MCKQSFMSGKLAMLLVDRDHAVLCELEHKNVFVATWDVCELSASGPHSVTAGETASSLYMCMVKANKLYQLVNESHGAEEAGGGGGGGEAG